MVNCLKQSRKKTANNWGLTGRVVVQGQGFIVAVVAVVAEQRLVIVVLIPVE